MSEPRVVVYGISRRCAPVGTRHDAEAECATRQAIDRLVDEFPDVAIKFVDLRSRGSWPVQERLRRAVARPLCRWDVPILNLNGDLFAGTGPWNLAPTLGGLPEDTGSLEGFLMNPGATLEYMRRVDRDVDTLHVSMTQDAVAWARTPEDFRTGWTRFVADWKAFYKRNEGFVARTFADVWDDTKVYEQHLREWRERWKALGGRPAAPGSPQAHHMIEPPTPDQIGGAALGVGALIAALAGLYVIARSK